MWRQTSTAIDGPLAAATRWWEALLFGTIGTSIAVISIAILGMLMLAGRLPIRRGGSAIFGCFILFGAPTIVSGLMGGFEMAAPAEADPIKPEVAQKPAVGNAMLPKPDRPVYDPYAGAAVPVN